LPEGKHEENNIQNDILGLEFVVFFVGKCQQKCGAKTMLLSGDLFASRIHIDFSGTYRDFRSHNPVILAFNEFSGYIMVYHGISWYIMVYHGISLSPSAYFLGTSGNETWWAAGKSPRKMQVSFAEKLY